MSKYMTYAHVSEMIPLGEVEAPSRIAAVSKGERIAEEREVVAFEIVAEPVRDDEDA